jgi:hypothetical protein
LGNSCGTVLVAVENFPNGLQIWGLQFRKQEMLLGISKKKTIQKSQKQTLGNFGKNGKLFPYLQVRENIWTRGRYIYIYNHEFITTMNYSRDFNIDRRN